MFRHHIGENQNPISTLDFDDIVILGGLHKSFVKRQFRKQSPDVLPFWKDGFDVAVAFNNTKGPIVEIGGPTERGYELIKDVLLDKPVLITNHYGSARQHRLKPDLNATSHSAIIDMNSMGIADKSVGVILGSALDITLPPYGRPFLDEAARVIEPGGFLVLQDAQSEQFRVATELGFEPYIAALTTIAEISDTSNLKKTLPKNSYVYSFVFKQPDSETQL